MSSRSRLPVVLFSAAIFSGAFLLFLVQPMVGKRILPWFGGGPGVWMVCLMFYQVTLFLGYLYAHTLVRFFSPLAQWGVHALLLVVALVLLPVLPADIWRPDGTSDPGGAIVTLLVANVFAPFLALAATGPLLQAWFSRSYPHRSPYPLFAVSNTGSFVALFLFPVVMEPFLPLIRSGDLWSLGYLAAAILILASGVLTLRRGVPSRSPAAPLDPEGERSRSRGDAWLWVGLSACAVVLLMAMTNSLCMDMTSVPFLWVLPLGLYLLSFILCFGSERTYKRSLWIALTLLTLLSYHSIRFWLPDPSPASRLLNSLLVQIPLLATTLFSLCMLLHGELYRLRPPARSLTSFYLAVSGGGALGGLFVGGLAVIIFDDYYELQTGYLLALVLIFVVLARDPQSWMHWRGPRWRIALASGLACVVAGYSIVETLREPAGLIHKERSFFGVARVVDFEGERSGTDHRVLRHGTTMHGAQLLDEQLRRRPITYFGLVTGIGMALAQRSIAGPYRLGVLGLGAGTLAAYGRERDQFRFYEIDPVVIKIAGRDGHFTYLEDSPANIEVVLGDARLSLQRELDSVGSQKFDVLVIDCFSSDSIPIHLLTKEALELYLAHLVPDGLLAFHTSNRFFDLEPIIYRLAIEFDLSTLTIWNKSAGTTLASKSWWIFLSPNRNAIMNLRAFAEKRKRGSGENAHKIIVRTEPRTRQPTPLWTDDYSSLLSLLVNAKR